MSVLGIGEPVFQDDRSRYKLKTTTKNPERDNDIDDMTALTRRRPLENNAGKTSGQRQGQKVVGSLAT